MARGGYRAGAGRPKSAKAPKEQAATSTSDQADIRAASRKAQMTPLEYMLSVLNDDEADDGRRDRMAVAAAPYVHAKADTALMGKKEQAEQAAKDMAVGKFAAPAPPKLIVDNR